MSVAESMVIFGPIDQLGCLSACSGVTAAAELAAVTPEQALKHPNWSMGPKITIDSATLMNKGLELIEAHYLFGVPYERITVVISPQSTVHSMARFADGAILAHLGAPDMRTPIGYALAYPERPSLPMVKRLDLFATQLAFHKPDTVTFRCLTLAEEAGRKAAIVACDAEAAGCAPRTVAALSTMGAATVRGAHRAQRRQRDRGAGVPRRPHRLPRHPGDRGEMPHLAGRRAGGEPRRRVRLRRGGAPLRP